MKIFNNKESINKHFFIACQKNNINVAKQLYNKGANIHYHKYDEINHACLYGHIDMIRWLYCINAYSKNNIKYIFTCACCGGNIEVAKCLYELDINNKIINDETINWAFVYACKRGHLNIVKWLYSLGAEIQYQNFCALKIALEVNQMEITEWICKKILKPYVRVIKYILLSLIIISIYLNFNAAKASSFRMKLFYYFSIYLIAIMVYLICNKIIDHLRPCMILIMLLLMYITQTK